VFPLVVALVVLATPAAGQTPPAQPPATPARAEAIRVFLDCVEARCDFDFLRTDITFVDFVRDRKDADLHLLITGQRTGGGGTEHTLKVIGLERFAGREDELRFVSRETDTADEQRRGLSRTIKMGLMRYVAGTPIAEGMTIGYRPAARETRAQPADDPWNFWVFRINARANAGGEASSKSSSVFGSFSANRTTEAWKINLSVNANYRESTFTLSSGEEFKTVTRDNGASGLVVKSLSEHWSAAARARVSSSTFFNQDLASRVAGGVEYNLFPYSESTRRRLTFQYTVGLDTFDYEEETIFDKLSETLVDHTLIVSLDVRQPWGESGASFEVSQFFDDPAKHRLVVFGDIEIRLFKGFTLIVNGNASRVRDQIYLPKEDATDEEILVRRRQLATSYRYGFSVGISYTFGSIFNNVVNPRFGGSGGPIFFF
jgi:hypothetical protein